MASVVRCKLELVLESLNAIEAECEDIEQSSSFIEEIADLRRENGTLASENESLRCQLDAAKSELVECTEKIVALRSVARALESENRLVSDERANMEKRLRLIGDNSSLKVAADQIDSLRRQLTEHEQELAKMARQFDHHEREKLKLLEQFCQSLNDVDQLRLALSNKDDTLDALRVAKRDVELRLQTRIEENSLLKVDAAKLRNAEQKLAALESELVMQTSIYDMKVNEMQVELDRRLEEADQSNAGEVEKVKGRYATMFHEKAEELQAVRMDYEAAVAKVEQQSRAICDHEYREKELKALLGKKADCHHAEFDRTRDELALELDRLRSETAESERALSELAAMFAQLQRAHVAALERMAGPTPS